jgi:hypothetical protein
MSRSEHCAVALQLLQEAKKRGFRDELSLLNDPDWRALRDLPGFAFLLSDPTSNPPP